MKTGTYKKSRLKPCLAILSFLFLSQVGAFSQTPPPMTPGLTATVTPVITAVLSPPVVSQPTVSPVETVVSPTQPAQGNNDHSPPVDHSDPRYQPQPPPAPHFDFEKNFFDRNHFQLEFGGGIDFFGQNFYTNSSNGGGLLGLGFLVNDDWSIWLTQSVYGAAIPYLDNSLWETVISARYHLSGSVLRPYLTLGGGFLYAYPAYYIFNNSLNFNTVAPLLQVGFGLESYFSKRASFFVEAKANFIFQSLFQNVGVYFNPQLAQVTAIEFPVDIGLRCNFFGDRDTAPNATPVRYRTAENFFIKAGAGSFLAQTYFDTYDRLNINGISNMVTQNFPVGGFLDSFAAGIDCADSFSYFVSAEWLARDVSFLANVQYTLFKSNLFEPYVYGGLGVNFANNYSIGPCAQLGLGTNLVLTKNFGLFLETKLNVANAYSVNEFNPTLSFVQWDLYWPVLAGVKVSL